MVRAVRRQAEGFTFTFGSALDGYRAELAAGRIHDDGTVPPVGALVFYDGGTNGHVAVSIGNGKEVGTYGYVGNQYPIMQYPVRGYLSNNYLGWALPLGS
jgi:cell wall-associated NlpC family hydrolase